MEIVAIKKQRFRLGQFRLNTAIVWLVLLFDSIRFLYLHGKKTYHLMRYGICV